MTSTTVALIDFHGDQIPSVLVDDVPHVVLKPVLESIGVDFSTQMRKLKSRSWASYRATPTTAADGKVYPSVVVDVRTLLMLLASISEDRVAPAARPKLVAYQAEVADVIEAYWTRGGVVNPRASGQQLEVLIDRAEGQMRVLRMAEGFLDPAWLGAKMAHVIARAIGEEPEIPESARPLTVSEYLEDKGLLESQIRSISPQFGKYLRAAYTTMRGHEPGLVPRFIDGAMRTVCGYTVADKPLFNMVWDEHYVGYHGG